MIKMYSYKNIRNKLWKSKKSENLLVDFWAILIFAIIMLLIFILFLATKRSTDFAEIELRFAEQQPKIMLNSYLKSPYGEGTIADMIVNDRIEDKDYINTKNTFAKFFKGIRLFPGRVQDTYYMHRYIYCIELIIDNDETFSITNKEYSNKISYEVDDGCDEIKWGDHTRAETEIPTQDGKDMNIKLVVYHIDRSTSQYEDDKEEIEHIREMKPVI